MAERKGRAVGRRAGRATVVAAARRDDGAVAAGASQDAAPLGAIMVRPDGPTFAALALDTPRPVPTLRPEAVYLASLAPSGRRSMRSRLLGIAALLGLATLEAIPWERLRYPQYAALRGHLAASGLKPASVNTTLAALRGVAREAWRLGHLTAEEHARVRDLRAVRGSTLPAGRAAAGSELAALFAACAADPGPAGARDGAIVALLYAAGVRRTELAGLALADYDAAAPALLVRHAKGRKERRVPLPPDVVGPLAAWLAVRGGAPGPFFYPLSRTGRLLRARRDRATGATVARALSAQAIYEVLLRRARAAGIAALSPHDLRRTFVGDLLDAGADLSTVQQLAGHATIATTARYDRRGEAAKVAAARLLRLPLAHQRPAQEPTDADGGA